MPTQKLIVENDEDDERVKDCSRQEIVQTFSTQAELALRLAGLEHINRFRQGQAGRFPHSANTGRRERQRGGGGCTYNNKLIFQSFCLR